MIIDVLVCRIDGTQVMEQREVPDNWFDAEETAAVETGEEVQERFFTAFRMTDGGA